MVMGVCTEPCTIFTAGDTRTEIPATDANSYQSPSLLFGERLTSVALLYAPTAVLGKSALPVTGSMEPFASTTDCTSVRFVTPSYTKSFNETLDTCVFKSMACFFNVMSSNATGCVFGLSVSLPPNTTLIFDVPIGIFLSSVR